MNQPADQRGSARIPFSKRVGVVVNGRLLSSVAAINLSLGGMLLAPLPLLAVGSRCEVDIVHVAGMHKVQEATVVRHTNLGTALQFATPLQNESLASFVATPVPSVVNRMANAYMNYFKVGQMASTSECERLFGITLKEYKRVFTISFVTCISLAILSVWVFRSLFFPFPTWAKIAMSFTYGFIWLAVVQPAIDLSVFWFLRRRAVKQRV